MAKKRDLDRGDRVKVTSVRQDDTGEQIPADIVGMHGTIEWITPGYAGEKSVFEVKLDDGRIVNLYAGEVDAI